MKVRFKNFRCFEDTGLLDLKKITLLVGENSSGKTSFLAGLNHMSGLLNDESIDLNSEPFELGAFEDILYRGAKNGLAESFEYEWEFGESKHQWAFKNKNGKPAVSNFKTKSSVDDFSAEFNFDENLMFWELPLSDEEQETLKLIGHGRIDVVHSKKAQLKRLKFQPNTLEVSQHPFKSSAHHLKHHVLNALEDLFDHLNESSGDIGQKLANKNSSEIDVRKLTQRFLAEAKKIVLMRDNQSIFVISFSALRANPPRVYSFAQSEKNWNPSGSHFPDALLLHSISTGTRKKHVNSMLNEFGNEAGLFKRIFVKKLGQNPYPFSLMAETVQGRTSNIVDIGYGVSQILPVIFDVISSPENIKFLIQQPEVHLHPRAQAAFGSLIAKLAGENEKSFVIETHSDFIVDRIKYEIEQGTISHDDVGILFFDTEEAITKVHQINLGKNGLPAHDLPASYRRFFLEEVHRVW